MKSILILSSLFVSLATSAKAENCLEHFVNLFANPQHSMPTKSFNTTLINGGNEQKTNVFSKGKDHMLTQALVPPAPWTLIYNKHIFISNDKGTTWQKIRTMSEPKLDDAAKLAKAKAIAKFGNAVCGEEVYRSQKASTVQADLDITPNASSKTTVKYWLDAQSGFPTKITSHTIAGESKILTTQIIEEAPDLELPTPE